MRESDLDDAFTEFAARTAPTFRPPGVGAVQRRVGDRRRHRRGLLAAAAALLLAGTAGGYALAGRDGDRTPPAPAPTPTVSPSPDGPAQRRIAVPGVPGELRELRFVDARHAWAFFDTCEADDRESGTCRRDLARTEDGGVTWRRAALPDVVDDAGRPYLLAVDDRRLTVVIGERLVVTTDGGASFTEHPVTTPPPATRLALGTRSGFLLRCPGAPALAPETGCTRQELARVDGTAPTQPPVTLRPDRDRELIETGDGRLWVAVRGGDGLTVVVSDDRAATWRRLPTLPDARQLLVSADGSDAWALSTDPDGSGGSAENRLWSLEDGDHWQDRGGLPDDTASVAPAGDGFLVVTGAYGTVGFWHGAGYLDRPELRGAGRTDGSESMSAEALPDGTVVLHRGDAWTFGVGRGPDRAWTRLS